jgi:hypothetical protein
MPDKVVRLDDPVSKATQASRESKYVEFKEGFDCTADGDWCEVIKDMIAIANSGGGLIVVGVDNHGDPVGFDVAPILAFDPADVANRIHRYTETNYADFDITSAEKSAVQIAVIVLRPPEYPIAFCKPGTYAIAGGKQKSAFAQGAVYFRHGAKSEPGVTEDLRKFVDRKVEALRREWLEGVRKVVSAPPGSTVAVQPAGEVRVTIDPSAARFRIVNDPEAPAFRQIDPNETHPYRQKEVIAQVRTFLPSGQHFTAHDALAVRRLNDIDQNPTFFYRPRFGSPQNSTDYVGWFREQISQVVLCLDDARSRFALLQAQ